MILQRSLNINDFVLTDDEDILEFSIASSEPYLRAEDGQKPYYEILEISDEAISFERLIDGKAPFLFEHDTTKQIGVIEKAFISDEKLKVLVRFSKNEFAQSVLKDIKAGIRRNVSVGYIIVDYRMQVGSDFDTMYVIHWIPYEGSSVSVPADHTVGYQRNLIGIGKMKKKSKKQIEEISEEIQDQDTEEKDLENAEAEVEEEEEKKDIETQDEAEETTDESTEDAEEEVEGEEKSEEDENAESEEDKEAEEIRAAGELVGEEELAEDCIKAKKSLRDFKSMLKQKRSVNNIKATQKGIKKMKKFSISKAIRNACSQYKADISNEYETEVINANKRALNISEEYDVIVTKSQLRALGPSATVGQELITGEYLPQEFTPALRPQLTLEATRISCNSCQW